MIILILRCMSYTALHECVCVSLAVPEQVMNLSSHWIREFIIITWMVRTCGQGFLKFLNTRDKSFFSQPPPPSTRPPVTGYKILHSTTGSVMITQTTDTKFIFESLNPGVYFFSVLATNILGDGMETCTVLNATGYCNIVFVFVTTIIIHVAFHTVSQKRLLQQALLRYGTQV